MSGQADDRRYEEFVLLYSRHQPAVFGYIFSLLPDWAEAEDVLQRTSVILWRKFGDFAPGTNFASWACAVARFTVLKRLRERSRDKLVFDDDVLAVLAEEGLHDLDRQAAERQALSGCLEKLPSADRALLDGYYGGQTAVAELAARFEQSVAAVYKRLSRTRIGLLKCIERQLAAEGLQ